MEYNCQTIEEYQKNLMISHQAGDIFLLSNEVWDYIKNQPERSKREDCKCTKRYSHDGEDLGIFCRCGALNMAEMS